MTNEQYIIHNREANVRSLALNKVPEGVNILWCLQQIEGYQSAKKKLPKWAAIDNIIYPLRLSMEQCSSEATALYKHNIVQRLNKSIDAHIFVDLTGGLGVDFSYMARNFDTAIYVEQQEILCETAKHNMPLLDLHNVKIVNADSTSYLKKLEYSDIIYIDPARRDNCGKKTIAIEDCTPNISVIQHELLKKSRFIIIKLSPMLDITQALRTLTNVCEIHVVSVKGECKELLCILSFTHAYDVITYHCVNLETKDAPFSCISKEQAVVQANLTSTSLVGQLLFEPNASILKAGVQDAFAIKYNLHKLHPMSNLFICSTDNFYQIYNYKAVIGYPPARIFHIVATSDFSKKSLKELLRNTHQGNITIRNFPSTVASLRKRLKLKDGGDDYFFATTLSDNRHILIKCQIFINRHNVLG